MPTGGAEQRTAGTRAARHAGDAGRRAGADMEHRLLVGPSDRGRKAGLDPTVLDHVLEALRGDGAAAEDWPGGSRKSPAPRCRRTPDARRSRSYVPPLRFPGSGFGSHTWSHGDQGGSRDRPSIASWRRLSGGCVSDSRTWYHEHFLRGCPARGASGRARAAGYDGALRITGGWVSRGDAGGHVLRA